MNASDLFGKIALRKGFLSEDTLYRALRFQEEVRALGLSKPLGAICLMQGALEQDQVDLVLRLQHLNEKAQRERRFGVTAVANGFIAAEELEAALATARKESFGRTLGEILVKSGVIDTSTAHAIERAIVRRDALALLEENEPPLAQSESRTDRLAKTIDVEGQTELDLEQRVHDVLFAAVALRDGHVLAPELVRCLREQLLQASQPRLDEVLLERGILDAHTVARIHEASLDAQAEHLTIPGYELLEVLGGGTTSIVLRARHELIDREVAIKLIRADQVDATGADMLEEAKTYARLRHPKIVGLYEVGRVHRRVFFVMELAEGKTLLDRINASGPLDELHALRVAHDVCEALAAVEAAGLVHRDVKPGNIVLDPDGSAKLTDLGLAREVDRPDTDAPNAIYGTPHTMSPEQANGDPVDIRSDLYGLGATLFQALVGEPPYSSDKPLEVLMAHITAPVPDPRTRRPQLCEGTSRLVMRLLAKKPEDRPQSPADAIRELEALL